MGAGWPKISGRKVNPTNNSSFQKTRLNNLLYGIKIIWTIFFSVLSQFTRLIDVQTDRQTNSFFIAKPRLHSMQRGKKDEIWAVDSQEHHWNCCHQMSDFIAKIHQNRFRLGLPHTRLGELTAFPTASSWNKGDLIPREEKKCREGKGKTGRKSEGRREEGRRMKTIMNTIRRRGCVSAMLAPSIGILTYLLLIYSLT